MFNRSSPATVTVDLMATLVSADGDQLPVWAALRYDVSDPYAIHATFTLPSGPQVPWVFARDLLASGILGAAGLGDVRIWRTSPDDPRTSPDDPRTSPDDPRTSPDDPRTSPDDPRASPDDRADVNIGLNSPDGEALLQFSAAELTTFLGQTYAQCSHGDEHVHLDVDHAIERLLAS